MCPATDSEEGITLNDKYNEADMSRGLPAKPCLAVLIFLYSLHQPVRKQDDPCLVHELRKADGLAGSHTLQLISTEGKLGQMRISS